MTCFSEGCFCFWRQTNFQTKSKAVLQHFNLHVVFECRLWKTGLQMCSAQTTRTKGADFCFYMYLSFRSLNCITEHIKLYMEHCVCLCQVNNNQMNRYLTSWMAHLFAVIWKYLRDLQQKIKIMRFWGCFIITQWWGYILSAKLHNKLHHTQRLWLCHWDAWICSCFAERPYCTTDKSLLIFSNHPHFLNHFSAFKCRNIQGR